MARRPCLRHPGDDEMTERKKRGRPPKKTIVPIPDTFENVLKAVVQPMPKAKREETTREIKEEERRERG